MSGENTSLPEPGEGVSRSTLIPDVSELWLSLSQTIFVPALAVVAALMVGAIILGAFGYNPLKAYAIMLEGIFGSQRNISEVLLRSTPLIFTGICVAMAYSCGVWNIGGEGQFYLGAMAATWVGINGKDLPSYILIPALLSAGFVFGGLWAVVPGWLKIRLGTNEVVMTIMLNYIAIGINSFLVTGPMKEKAGYFPQTDALPAVARLPGILEPTRLHIGFLLALVLAIVMTIVMFRTPLGFAIRTVGLSPKTAKYAGIHVNRTIILAMLLSGGAAGLGGAVEIAGLTGRLFAVISPGYGFDGIAVSLLVQNNPIGTILSGFLFGGLRSGSELMQINAGVPAVLIQIIQGLTIAFVIAFGTFSMLSQQKKRRIELEKSKGGG
jgi:general nucleoside transport system permease protein